MFLNFKQILTRIEEDKKQDVINHQKNLAAWRERNGYREYDWGANIVGDHDEDYVFDALFDVPNR